MVNSKKKILIETSVWVSYFGDRNIENNCRIKTAREVISFCLKEEHELLYCHYVLRELQNYEGSKRKKDIEELKNIAKELPSNIGAEPCNKIEVPWDKIGSVWNNNEENKQEKRIEASLPDKNNKSNKNDRKILLTAHQQGVNILLHENPKDFKKIKLDNIQIINLLEVKTVDEFRNLIK